MASTASTLQLELRVEEVGADRVRGVVEDRVVLRRVDARRWRSRGGWKFGKVKSSSTFWVTFSPDAKLNVAAASPAGAMSVVEEAMVLRVAVGSVCGAARGSQK